MSGLSAWWDGAVLWWRGLSTGDVLAFLGIVATIVVAVVPALRAGAKSMINAAFLRGGRSERRYAKWFVEQWGVYENPYLDDKEDLDLDNTYVSLSLCPPDSNQETRTGAGRVLADRQSGNLVIEGDPGSGKSTLLKAYGVGAFKSRRRLLLRSGRRDDQVPFFVQLRKLARRLDGSWGLADYIVDEVLVSGAGLSRANATEFLRYVLAEGRVLVMLDGLDEVTADRQQAVLEAVYAFAHDRTPELPTASARVVVTCRRQNFIALRDQWVPVIAETVSRLVPLRDSEVFAYLDKLRRKFKVAGGPETFMSAVRASGTLDLHRTPLILAMSVGLYARKDFYEIPRSIAKLYRTMIEEMLDRQRFRFDPGGGAVVLPVDDKYRFLREFALDRVLGSGGFDDFGRREMVDFATGLAPSLREVRDPLVLVAEVADRSGLVDDVSEAGRYVFAHRSLHEYLVTEELLALPDGEATLLDRATDPEWRQVVLFFAAGLDQRRGDVFLPALAARSTTLAGHCLARAEPSDCVAERILDGLLADGTDHLTALVAATTSPRRSVQEMAVRRLEHRLQGSMRNVRAAFHGDVEGMLPLLNALSGSNAVRIAGLVPQIVATLGDDPRLVEPLWRCLTVPGIERAAATRAIVERLLVIAMTTDGFAALMWQEPYTRPFLDRSVRDRAYPFDNALPKMCNLVTLLTWAEYLDALPVEPNRFFAAKAAGRLDRVEVDWRRTVSFSLFWPARIISLFAVTGSVAALVAVLIVDWRTVLHPFGWSTPLLSLGLSVAAVVTWIAVTEAALKHPGNTRMRRYLGEVEERSLTAHFIYILGVRRYQTLVGMVPSSAFAVSVPGLLADTFPSFVAAAFVVPLLVFWAPTLGLFCRTTRFCPYRPNPFIDMYDDPRSCHWLNRPPTNSAVEDARPPVPPSGRAR